jgi:lipopolysaccharide/colanic/teichoic acid biosynthesis glycosyltransferase
MQQRGWRLLVKRGFDVGVALGVLAAGAPVLGAAALAIRATMGGQALFRQQRPGRGGRPFTLYKFRTMRPGPGSDLERLTPLGKLLRATSVDELPQLFNVLRGDMSLVGPRPLLMEYLGLYTPEQARRHEVLPGITGWAQINGRNGLTHEACGTSSTGVWVWTSGSWYGPWSRWSSATASTRQGTRPCRCSAAAGRSSVRRLQMVLHCPRLERM